MPPCRASFRSASLSAILGCLVVVSFSGSAEAQIRGYLTSSEAALPFAPLPADPHELANGGVQVASTPTDRLAAFNLLREAAENSVSHRPKMEPFSFQVSFTASGNVSYTGSGELTEIWMSGQNWRITESLGGWSMVRTGYSGKIADQQPVSMIPMRAQMLRNEVMWATSINAIGARQIRTVAAQWNSQPVTCILLSPTAGAGAQTTSRSWDENEYCVDNHGRLQIHSIVPGTYAIFGYGKNLQFHGKPMADHIAIYVNGEEVIDSNFSIGDPSADDQALLVPPQTATRRPAVALSMPGKIPINVEAGVTGNTIEPVILHAQLDSHGAVTETEVSASADPALTQRAMDTVKAINFGGGGVSHAYLIVRFLPAAQ